MKQIYFFLFSFLPCTILAKDPYPKNPNIDILNYKFEIHLNDTSDIIYGSADITLNIKDSENRVRLDLISQGKDGSGMEVKKITFNGSEVSYSHENDVLLIETGALEYSSRDIINVVYSGMPITGLIIGPNMHGDRTFFSDNWPNKARNWLPIVDHPYDKSTAEFIVIAPNHYQVISNGLLVEETNLSKELKKTHWKQSVPISCWLYALGVAEFAVDYVEYFEGKSIQTWVYKQDRDNGFYDFKIPTKHTMEFFSDYIGPFAYEKLANVQSNSVKGGMESATAIFYSDVSVTGDRSVRWRNVVIHEVAHQWFGNCVTEYDWDDVWLSEGFATYFTLMFREHAYGRDDFVNGLNDAKRLVYNHYKTDKESSIVHNNLKEMKDVLTYSLQYQKGAWVLHMLRNYVGEDNFRHGIRNYYKKYYNSTTTTNQFKTEMEVVSGMNLDTFFHQWLYKGGNIVLDGNWKFDEKKGRIEVNLNQVQNDGYLFEMPIELGISYNDKNLEKIQTVKLEKEKGRFYIASDSKPISIKIDPNTKLLAIWDFNEIK
ncbi:MAG: M1 family peptidase [Rickettsiales bacterium TMED289]|nr:MAG: M1 family peptidase [Rickettsiales bacterium TMED289]